MVSKWIKSITSRAVITGALIFLQACWLVMLFFQWVEAVAWLSAVFYVLSLLIVLYIINKDENPAYKIAWIILLLLFPVMGSPMYLLFGNKRPTRVLRRLLEKQYARSKEVTQQSDEPMDALGRADPRALGSARYILNQSGRPLYGNTRTRYFSLGDTMYPCMLQDLEKAEKFIFLEYFILDEGEMLSGVLEVLQRKAAQGVDVRILYDDMGSVSLVPVDFPARMQAIGVKCLAFNRFVPLVSFVMNSRDHRKLMIVDGRVCYTGGINLADEYINRKVKHGHWKDTGLRLEGEAVWSQTCMFLEMWNALRKTDDSFLPFRPQGDKVERDGFVQPFGDTPLDNEPLSENLYIDLLGQAARSVDICSPYLLISSEMQNALCQAARRGVKVRLFTPGIPDKKIVYRLTRSYYPPLIRAGVKVFEYTPGFLHAKSILVDGKMAVVGTINLDFRSLYLHFECGVLMWGSSCIKDIEKDMDETQARCRQVTLEQRGENLLGRLLDSLLRLFAPLM